MSYHFLVSPLVPEIPQKVPDFSPVIIMVVSGYYYVKAVFYELMFMSMTDIPSS